MCARLVLFPFDFSDRVKYSIYIKVDVLLTLPENILVLPSAHDLSEMLAQ